MKKLNSSQVKGIAILVFGIIAGLLLENSFFQFVSGVLSAVGLSYILKFLPVNIWDLNLKRRDSKTID